MTSNYAQGMKRKLLLRKKIRLQKQLIENLKREGALNREQQRAGEVHKALVKELGDLEEQLKKGG